MTYKKFFKEDISIPLNVNDEFLYGKFKNKRGVVKSFTKNEKGEILIVTTTGAKVPLLKIRLVNSK